MFERMEGSGRVGWLVSGGAGLSRIEFEGNKMFVEELTERLRNLVSQGSVKLSWR